MLLSFGDEFDVFFQFFWMLSMTEPQCSAALLFFTQTPELLGAVFARELVCIAANNPCFPEGTYPLSAKYANSVINHSNLLM